jgi:hypothetical protein
MALSVPSPAAYCGRRPDRQCIRVLGGHEVLPKPRPVYGAKDNYHNSAELLVSEKHRWNRNSAEERKMAIRDSLLNEKADDAHGSFKLSGRRTTATYITSE